jgi:hypothetical protein
MVGSELIDQRVADTVGSVAQALQPRLNPDFVWLDQRMRSRAEVLSNTDVEVIAAAVRDAGPRRVVARGFH